VRDEAREVVYAKMLKSASILIADSLKIKRDSSQLIIRSLPDGESSASVMPFPDDSFFIRVSDALLDAIMTVSNMMVAFERNAASVQTAFTRRGRQHKMQETMLELSAALRAWIIFQRMTGAAQGMSFNLIEEDFQAAGAIALDALEFVLAHELAHIGLKHRQAGAEETTSNGHVNQSQVQELQADNLAVHMVRGERSNQGANRRPMWGVFLALMATEITESAIYVRRNSTHPLAWARWAVLDKMLGGGDQRAEAYQAAILGAMVAALKLDGIFPADGWIAMQRAPAITASIDLEQIALLDRLLTAPIRELLERTESTSSIRGREILALMRGSDFVPALSTLGAENRYIQAIADDRKAVAFFTIRRLIESACEKNALHSDSTLYSVVGTRVLARALTKETHHSVGG
jgi:hypothetical protein